MQERHRPDETIGDYVGHGRRNVVSKRDVFVSPRASIDGISGHTTRRIALAFRAPKNYIGARKLFDEEETYRKLQSAGIPVAHATYRLDPSEHAVYCTELTQGGKYFVFSDTNHTSQDREWQASIGAEAAPAPNALEALDALTSIALQCTKIDAELMLADAFYFIIDKKTRVIRVTIGDYKHVVEAQTDADLVLKNNLAVARQAAHARPEIFGLTHEEIDRWFDQKECEITAFR